MSNSEKKGKGIHKNTPVDQENVTERSGKLLRKPQKFQKIKGLLVPKSRKKILPRISRSNFIKIKTLHINTNKLRKPPHVTFGNSQKVRINI